MKTIVRNSFAIAAAALAAMLLAPRPALAHCDGLDGPVVQAAKKALASTNVNLVLIWVQKGDEAEIRRAFGKTLAVRKLGVDARELADTYFFETLVRLHRAGEGAPYTGLKPAGRDLGPAIPAADQALKDGRIEALMNLLTQSVRESIQQHFNEALTKKNFAENDINAGREFVKAYVEYIHCVEALYEQAATPQHGHVHEAGEAIHHREK